MMELSKMLRLADGERLAECYWDYWCLGGLGLAGLECC